MGTQQGPLALLIFLFTHDFNISQHVINAHKYCRMNRLGRVNKGTNTNNINT